MQHKYDSAGVLELIDRYGGTNVHLVPTQMKRLVDLPSDVRERFKGSTLDLVLHGAAPCPPVIKHALIDWWGPKITEYYGSTEGSVVTMIDSANWVERGGSVGQAMPNMEIMIRRRRGRALPAKPIGNYLLPQSDGHGFRVSQRT